MFERFKKEGASDIKLPKHVAVIMDGNGRWAKKRLQPRVFGHKAGMDALQEVTLTASQMGIKVLTVYAFSTENWSRPEEEVSFLMKLPVDFFDKYVPELDRNGVNIQVMGELDRLPQATREALERACQQTATNSGLILNFALNYGGRAELTKALQTLAREVQEGKRQPEDLTEAVVADHLMTASLPPAYRDPDLIIRTSGEQRLSNFLPWQAAYSEFYFTDVLWPDFKGPELEEAILDYSRRHRRFGGL